MILKGNIDKVNYKTQGSAGFDLRSTQDIVLPPGEWYAVPTGVYIEDADEEEYLSIVPRSGLAYKYGVTVLNSPGTIDSDYRDEIKVLLVNLSKENYFAIRVDDRIAQAILCETKQFNINIEISNSIRSGGLGSTGVE